MNSPDSTAGNGAHAGTGVTAPADIAFYCVACGVRLIAGPEHGGKICECPKCSRLIPVPPPVEIGQPEWAVMYPVGILAFDIPLPCPTCETDLLIAAKAAGASVRCPACANRFRVPRLGELMELLSPQRAPAAAPTPRVLLTAAEFDFLSGALPFETPDALEPVR